jgi:FdhD protein
LTERVTLGAAVGGGRPGSRSRLRVTTVDAAGSRERADQVATEEPLEIRLRSAGDEASAVRRTVAITMRTPGQDFTDFELAVGFLHGEGLLCRGSPGAIAGVAYCTDLDVAAEHRWNVVTVTLRARHLPEGPGLDRHTLTTSACGVCGSASLEALADRGLAPVGPGPVLDPALVRSLPERMRAAQGVFRSTGGLHAAALFDGEGSLRVLREDVGRHNAVDKVVGHALLEGWLPLSGHVLLVSGRTSYEILQKAVAAGVPIVAAVSAPSSLAVDLARRFGVTLVGFLRGDRFNVYAGEERVAARP